MPIFVTVQPCISYIHKPASELSVAALQLMFTHFRNERLFYHKKVLNNTMNKLIVLPIIFLWLNCYSLAEKIIKIMKKRFLPLQDEFYAPIDRIFWKLHPLKLVFRKNMAGYGKSKTFAAKPKKRLKPPQMQRAAHRKKRQNQKITNWRYEHD